MSIPRADLSTGRLLGDALRALVRPPFVTLFLIGLLASFAGASIAGQDEAAFFASLVLLAVSVYVGIAVVLAAGADDPVTGADPWLRAALRRRCFWRVLGASLFSVVLILLGLIALIVGAVVVAGYVGLASTAAVLERVMPADSIRRSAKLTEPARFPVALISTACFLLPTVGIQAGLELGWPDALGLAWFGIILVAEIFAFIGNIALARAFVALGGTPTPRMSELLPPREPLNRH